MQFFLQVTDRDRNWNTDFSQFFFFWSEVTFYLFIFKNSFSFHHSTSSLPSYQPSYTQHTKSSYQKVIQNPRKYRRYFLSFEKKWLKRIWISFPLIRPSFFLNSTNSSQFGSRQTIPSLSSSCIPSLITLQQRFAILWLVGFLVYTLFWLVGCFILLCCDWLAAFICLIFYAQFFACRNHHICHYILWYIYITFEITISCFLYFCTHLFFKCLFLKKVDCINCHFWY